ncbi:hypothetical protein FD35_GL002550 [Furfurilactobacillus rossiae DSM 15814]|uniref:Uncharacterized protein n=1 Tax=Furfurilactobacillus rossiae DSM 15814 TaxID=1114972 RepID=A0A0R1RJJ9_9LACO|nr:hypothetical protein FD35_GL002550 [Furfurilactobacillus rossiae DSM 15814]
MPAIFLKTMSLHSVHFSVSSIDFIILISFISVVTKNLFCMTAICANMLPIA